jgi:putative glutathione S-transferase
MHYRHNIALGLFLTIGVARCLRLSPPHNQRRASTRDVHRKDGPAPRLHAVSSPDGERMVVPPLNATRDDSSTSLYQTIPSNRPWTFGILTSGFPPQQLLVPVVKFVTFHVWKLMMNELVTHDDEGRFVRESYQAGDDPMPLEISSIDKDVPTYKLYLGNPCPWCHRVMAAVTLLGIEDDIPITALIDDAEKASKGGWILPNPSPRDIGLGIADELIRGDLAGVYNYCHRDTLNEGERYGGRCTAPLLVNVKTGKIVTNESNEIMILLNDYARRKRDRYEEGPDSGLDLRPVGMEMELDRATKRWFDLLWNGSYRCGFATSQIAYDEVSHENSMDKLDYL